MADSAPVTINADTHDISATPKKFPDELKQDRHFRAIQFYAALVLTMLFVAAGGWAVFLVADPKVSEWGRSILLLILGGVIGIVFAKK